MKKRLLIDTVAIPENLRGKLIPPSYWKSLSEQDIVVFRAELGDKEAVEALRQLTKLQLQALTTKGGKNGKIFLQLVSAEVWNEAIKSNPPLGEG